MPRALRTAHRADEGVEFLWLLLAGYKIGGSLGGPWSACLLSLFKLRMKARKREFIHSFIRSGPFRVPRE
jgi:hypothetical protein